MGPGRAPDGTVAAIFVSDATVNAAARPLKVTEVAPVKALALIVTGDPTLAEDGETPKMAAAGCAVTVHDAGLAPIPGGVVTEIGPVVAPGGRAAVIWLSGCTEDRPAARVPPPRVAPANALPTL